MRHVAPLVFLVALAVTCGQAETSAVDPTGRLVAEVAGFDISTERSERFIVGLFASNRGDVALGTVEFEFSYLGPLDGPSSPGLVESVEVPQPAPARFLALPGREQVQGDRPTFDPPDGARGVYGTEPITFPEAGVWEVTVLAPVDGDDLSAVAAFEVLAESTVPGPGDAAPRSVQPLPGGSSVSAAAIDSRMIDTEELPDPALHQMTIADALDASRPVMVAVTTPVFCVSRFCGPITDELARLESTYGDRVEFVHLEVWEDFETQSLNPAAAEWIAPDGSGEAAEPWVFLADGDGVIVARWDNVASVAELTVALDAIIG